MKLKSLILYILTLYFSATSYSPNIENDSLSYTVDLEEVVIVKNRKKLSDEDKKKLLQLMRRIYKVYPYAKITSEKLTELNRNLAQLKTKRDKSRYLKLVEKYIENEFEDRLKKFSRREGQILVKLIYRQTGETTFNLLKEFKSGWTAFWYNKIGGLYDIDIKATYNPKESSEDYLIERLLNRGFTDGRLQFQEAKTPINLDYLTEYWTEKEKNLINKND